MSELEQKAVGWSRDFPIVSGWYWMRGYRQYRTLPVEINGDQLSMMYGMGTYSRQDVEDAEFRGPISPDGRVAASDGWDEAIRIVKDLLPELEENYQAEKPMGFIGASYELGQTKDIIELLEAARVKSIAGQKCVLCGHNKLGNIFNDPPQSGEDARCIQLVRGQFCGCKCVFTEGEGEDQEQKNQG